MTKRRIILIGVAGALAAIYIAQILLSLRSPQKTFTVKETPDFISIENSGELITAQKSGDEWICGANVLDATKVEYLVNEICNIKTLGVATRAADQNALTLYGLDAPITVCAKAGGKDLCTLLIGKESATGSQVYIQFAGKKEIYLAQGNLRRDFTFKPENLLQKEDEEETEKQIIEDTH